MNATIRDKITKSGNLPSLPSVAIEVVRLCQQERTRAEELGEVLSQDPALAAKVLKLANSPFFGLRNEVSTVSHAVVMLGMVSVRTIALGFSLVKGLSRAAPRGFAHREYWARSLVSATAARVLATTIGGVNREEAFLAALLQNLGSFILGCAMPEEMAPIAGAGLRHHALPDQERELVGVDHCEVGAWQVEQWHLPSLYAATLRYHHAPESCDEADVQAIVKVAAVADLLAEAWVTDHKAEAIHDARRLMYQFWCADDDTFSTVLEKVGLGLPEVSSVFEIEVATDAELETVQQKAKDLLHAVPLAVLLQAADEYGGGDREAA